MSKVESVSVMKLARAAANPLDTTVMAEQSTLGALLLDSKALDLVRWLRVSDFCDAEHRRIYQAILDCAEDDGVVDLLTVATRLSGHDADGVTVAYLGSLAQNTPSALNIRRYAELVRERAERREIAAIGADLVERASAPTADVAALRRDLAARIMSSIQRADLLHAAFWVIDAKVSTTLPYVVKGLFARGHVIVFWGAPGSGKTFITLELACSVGAGATWRGRRTRRSVVLYVLAESTRAHAENRIAALRQESPAVAKAEVLVVPLALDLLHETAGDVDRVIETARVLTRDVGEVGLIVVDTLAVTFGGGNENAPEDMGMYVSNVRRIRDETGAAVLIVHHAGKDEAKGMRGHTALLGAIDGELAIEGPPGGERILRTGKVRDGEGYTDLFAFSLRRVALGTDQDGEPVTTCVVQSTDAAGTQRARRKRKGATLGKHQKAALRALEELGGRCIRTVLANKLKDDGMPRNRVPEAIGALLESGMLIAHNDSNPPEIAFP